MIIVTTLSPDNVVAERLGCKTCVSLEPDNKMYENSSDGCMHVMATARVTKRRRHSIRSTMSAENALTLFMTSERKWRVWSIK